MKQQLDVIVVDLKLDVLCTFSAEVNVSSSEIINSCLFGSWQIAEVI